MNWVLGCAAAVVVASLGACAPRGDNGTTKAPLALAGKWLGTITCYKMESPLTMTVDAARPTEATMASGEGGALTWHATVTIDDATSAVTLAPKEANVEAGTLTGKLSSDHIIIVGNMQQQLCTSFKLARQT